MTLDARTARRAYLLVASAISIMVVLWGAANLGAVLIEIFLYPPPQPYPTPRYYPGLPGAVAWLIVGLVVWGFHWMMLRGEE